tara:strand:- start:346 stop:660 length:315 start_codon:yes stop_codon:yes gene_type:complete
MKFLTEDNSQPIQLLAQGTVVNKTVTASSSALTIPVTGKGQAVRVSTSEAAYVNFSAGGTPVTASNGTLLPGGSITDWAIAADISKMTVLQLSTGGIISLTVLA